MTCTKILKDPSKKDTLEKPIAAKYNDLTSTTLYKLNTMKPFLTSIMEVEKCHLLNLIAMVS